MASSSDARSITITNERTYVSILIVILIVIFAVVQAVKPSFPAISRRQTNVEIVAGDVHRRTQSVKGQKAKITWWDFNLALSRASGDKCLGKIDINLESLLDLRHLRSNEDVVLSLVDKKGTSIPARLSVRVTQDSMSAVMGGAVEQA